MALTADQIGFYRENGYAVLRGVFSPLECEDMRREIDAVVEALSQQRDLDATWPGRWQAGSDGHVLSVHDLQLYSALFTRLMCDERLTAPTASLIGDNVQLHHIKMHKKPAASGSAFPLHQDYPYFPHERATLTAMVVWVDDADAESGGICVVPGSHRLGPLRCESDGSYYLPPQEWPLSRAVPIAAAAGDVTLLSCLVVHGSYPNVAARDRRMVLFQYRAPDDRPLQDTHQSFGQGTMVRGRWVPGNFQGAMG